MAQAAPNRWDRLPDEPDKAWQAFVEYRDMGLNRSLAKVGRTLGKAKQNCEGWSVKFDWVGRCRAYEDHVDKERQRRAQRKLDRLIRRNITMTSKAQDVLIEALENVDYRNLSENTSLMEVLPKWIAAVTGAQRALTGTPSLKVEVSGEGGGPVEFLISAKQLLASKLGEVMAEGETVGVDPKSKR